MIVVLKPDATESEIEQIVSHLESRQLKTRLVTGAERSVVAVIGNITSDVRSVEDLPGVAECIRISRPYKLASREGRPDTTRVTLGDIVIGGSQVVVMAGPCSVEGREKYLEAADACHRAGATILRGGAFKPRTSPYTFQGLGEEGLKIMAEARARTGMPIVTEIVSPVHAELFARYVDIVQIGARNMQNFELLKAVGELHKPVLLKRGLSATIEELLMAAEYLLAGGTEQVILCERGIRTYENATRNTLDLSAIPVLRHLSHLPVVVDPSHGTGNRAYVQPMALAAIAAGADGLIIEVHPHPTQALSDGPQSLYPQQLERLLQDVEAVAPIVGRQLYRPARVQMARAAAPPEVAQGSAPLTVAYQGQAGAFSERAARQFFGDTVKPRPSTTFRDVFEAVAKGEVDYGIVPVENSLAGSIHQNFDLLLEYPNVIIGEIKLRIVHSLIAWPGTTLKDIRTVYAHPQAAAQCDDFLRAHAEWQVINVYDTAGSVDYIRTHGLKDAAAIAGAGAAAIYEMEVVKEGIESNASNFTRFLAIGRPGSKAEAPDKTSIVFQTHNQPGALSQVLSTIGAHAVNMVKLESRPIPGQPWEYMFYADLQVAPDQAAWEPLMAALKEHTQQLRVLGSYHAAV